MVICDRESLPVSVYVGSASPHEVTLVERTLAGRLTKAAPVHLVADRAYDSDPHDRLVKERFGSELIFATPQRSGESKNPGWTQTTKVPTALED